MKTIKTLSYIVLKVFFLLAMSSGYAQTGTLQGKITDKTSGEAVPYATIIVTGIYSTANAISDMTGFYKISVSPGEYKIKVQYLGYKNYEIRRLIVNKDSITVADIALEVSAKTLDMVEILEPTTVLKKDVSKKSESKRAMTTGATYSYSTAETAYDAVIDADEISTVTYAKESSYAGDYEKSPVTTTASKTLAFGKTSTATTDMSNAGKLTAGELNDFAKWTLWNDITSSTLSTWQEYWKFRPLERYSLQIVNKAGKPVVDANVQLLSKKGKIIWESKSDNTGKAEMWANLYEKSKDSTDFSINVTYDDRTYNSDAKTQFQQGINVITIPVECNIPKDIDIMFMVDATGSMSDEINYLKAELLDVINAVKEKYPDNTVNLGCVFYRDRGDEYVTRKFDLTSNVEKVMEFINQQYAGGGGDAPEAVDSALSVAVNKISWSEDAVARMMFLILDAPPHYNPQVITSLQKNIQKASSKGIRLVPVIASGMTKDGEYLLRSFALATNGNYIFLTDHSGIGGTHLKPTTDEYDVTLLKDLLRKTINNFVYVAPCDEPIKVAGIKDTMTVVNPNIIAHVVIDSNKIIRYNVPLPQTDTNRIVLVIDTASQDTNRTGQSNQTDTTNSNRTNTPIEFNSFKYYPNPTYGQLFIDIVGDAKEIYLADITGKLLEKYEVTERKIEINISKYSAGIYFLQYSYKDKWLTGKVVLQK